MTFQEIKKQHEKDVLDYSYSDAPISTRNAHARESELIRLLDECVEHVENTKVWWQSGIDDYKNNKYYQATMRLLNQLTVET